MRFDPEYITTWLKSGSTVMIDEQAELKKLRDFYQTNFPEAIKALKEFDAHFSVNQPKGFSLSKIANRKMGFLYYVRYLEDGKLIPSRWCTHTNDRETAEQFARDNRERILSEYRHKKNHGMYTVLGNYYKKNSAYLETDKQRGRVISAKTQVTYCNFMNKVLIPFLRKQKIKEFVEITPPVINDLQNYLLKKGNKPQTINRFMGGFKAIINYLVMHGKLDENVFTNATMLKVPKKSRHTRGCYEADSLKGVFNKTWDDTVSFLLCLMIYTTGMRNSEIEKIQVKDLIKINGVTFIDIPESKTENGIRIVPLHPFVHKKLLAFIEGKEADDYIFTKKGNHIQSPVYKKAAEDMTAVLEAEKKDTENISFYSGRHFWKTLMSSQDLGNVEEYFMGHKVSKDVAKLYNHLDKQGQKKIIEKAKEVIKILDRRLFI